ncbi:MAG: YncE family protein [Planctomycetota bacterium]
MLAVAILGLSTGCGGGGGGGGGTAKINVDDVVIPLRGTGSTGITETYSRTPEEANVGNGSPGAAPPAFPAAIVSGQNQFLRIQFPFDVDPTSVLNAGDTDFSTLNGNIEITDQDGNHLPGVAAVGGKDASGKDLTKEQGWPVEPNSSGGDRNAAASSFVYIARGLRTKSKKPDPGLTPPAAFGGWTKDSDGDVSTTDITKIKMRVHSVNGIELNCFYTIAVGAADADAPRSVRVTAVTPVPGQPDFNGVPSADVSTDFLVEFSEPMTPQSVGLSARLNTTAFNGNIPNLAGGAPANHLPHVNITSSLNKNVSPLYIPFDCNPVNNNNNALYLLHPLINLPPNSEIAIVVRDVTQNLEAAFDYSGNSVDKPRGVKFVSGDGPAVVNAPVSPEVVYWISGDDRGMGAIDLNGLGFTTNKPNAHGDPTLGPDAQPKDQLIYTSIITSQGQYNLITGQARKGTNIYTYPVGTGSQALAYQTKQSDPGTPGNPGTPIPGVNEKSDGPDTLVRDSKGSSNLTGGRNGLVGVVTDCEIGDSLDRVFFDTLNLWAQPTALRTSFNPFTLLLPVDKNNISDPPVPNPPPLRYSIGLQPLSFVIDTTDPKDPIGLLIEGEEVFSGLGESQIPAPVSSPFGKIMMIPNPDDPVFGPDVFPKPYYDNGPPPQTATASSHFAARQQIGNFLYVCDQTNNQLKVLNSNTFRVITSIDLPDPWGVGIMPHLRQAYVSNFGDDSVSVIGTDPASVGFHQEMARIPVGNGPRGVACQVDAEDVLVANWTGNTVDIVNPGTNTVRKTLTALINQPYEIVTTERQTLPYQGFQSGIYFAYISNFSGNSVVVFESGPDGPFGIGLDNIRGEVPNDAGQDDVKLLEPRGMTFDPSVNREGYYAGGVFVAHRDEKGRGIVSQVQFTHQPVFGQIIINPPPGFFQPPGFSDRRFEVVAQWGTSDQFRLSGESPSDVALSDLDTGAFEQKPFGSTNYGAIPQTTGLYNNIVGSKHTWRVTIPFISGIRSVFPNKLYISYSDTGTIDVANPLQGNTLIKAIPGAGSSVAGLVHYWSQ